MTDTREQELINWLERESAPYRLTFQQAYMEAIHFTNSEEIGDADFAPETLETIKADCDKFLNLYGAEIESSMASIEQAGHDFWFTRCSHGVGFWDRPELYGDDLAEKLTNAVGYGTEFGNLDVYRGDNGLVYFG